MWLLGSLEVNLWLPLYCSWTVPSLIRPAKAGGIVWGPSMETRLAHSRFLVKVRSPRGPLQSAWWPAGGARGAGTQEAFLPSLSPRILADLLPSFRPPGGVASPALCPPPGRPGQALPLQPAPLGVPAKLHLPTRGHLPVTLGDLLHLWPQIHALPGHGQPGTPLLKAPPSCHSLGDIF